MHINSDSTEHRWGQRCPVDVRVSFRAPLIGGWGRIRNVSLSGAYIETAARPPQLERLTMDLEWSREGRTERSVLSAWIVRRDEHGFGVEWTEFAPWPVPALLSGDPAMRAQPAVEGFRLAG